jgi:hypothetical protein
MTATLYCARMLVTMRHVRQLADTLCVSSFAFASCF